MPQFNHIYLCPTLLEEQGFDLTGISPSSIWRAIWLVATMIDSMTQQWFNGDHDAWELDSFSQRLMSHRSEIPIICVDSIEISGDRSNFDRYPDPVVLKPSAAFPTSDPLSTTGWQTITTSSYAKHRRQVEVVSGVIPNGPKNVRLTGALGWVQREKNIRTTTVDPVESDTTEIELTSVAGISKWDVLDIFDATSGEGIRVMVTGVDRATNTVTIDPPAYMDFELAEGATVFCFGSPPLPIQELAGFLYSKMRKIRASNEAGEVPMDDARIKRERTDDYEYELFGASATTSGMGLVTGNMMYEEILHNYSKPGGVYYR